MHVSALLRVGMTVTDLRRAEAFYRDGLGFVRGSETAIGEPAWARLMGVDSAITVRAVGMRLGAQEIELVAFDPPGRPYPDARAANDRWFQHIAIVVVDIEGVFARLERLSSAPISTGGPQLLPANTGGVTAFKFRDPDGHPLELLYFPPGVGDAAWHSGEGSGPLGYDHSAIVVEDLDRSLSFYTELLGFRVGGRSLNTGVEQDRLDGLNGCVVDVVGLAPADVPTPHVELLHYRRPPGRAPSADVRTTDIASTRQVHRVDDLDGLVGRLEEAGAAFVSPGIVTFGNGERAASVRDPDGHMIMLTQ
jgi:catechol 2,3-dioxygenase-like lactoylglutathione lyase family enzyme